MKGVFNKQTSKLRSKSSKFKQDPDPNPVDELPQEDMFLESLSDVEPVQ